MSMRRLMQAALVFALFRLSRSPGRHLAHPLRKSRETTTLAGRMRDTLFGTGLVPALLADVVSDKQRAAERRRSH
jgi:hypothetical protein